MKARGRQVVDTNGVRYVLTREIGKGGQGAVFEVEGGKLAVKIVFDSSPSRRERLRNQLTHVKRLPLHDLAIAKPLEMLRAPELGYVMDLLTGMLPLKVLAFLPRGVPSVVNWYFSGGGLRRRLRILARAADALAQLHGKGLAYSDPSPHNIFVSASVDADEVRLIDADNLQYTSSPAGPSVFTPGYGAPEILLGTSGANSLTDAHAFAVLAFQTLAVLHPLIGDAVASGDPDQEDDALEGCLPWVDHPRNESNRATTGIPRNIVLSSRLAEICERTFGEGLKDPKRRPGIAEWSERLHAAADAALTCTECKGTYYFTAPRCPWCDHQRPSFVTAAFNLWDPSMEPGGELLQKPSGDRTKPVIVAVATISERDPLTISGRLARGHEGTSNGVSPLLDLRLKGERLTLRAQDDTAYLLTSPTGGRSAEVRNRPVEIKLEPGQASWRLHLGRPDQLHRVVTFELRPGGGA